MKKFLHKKWLSIPVIAILVLILTAGSILAAFNFLTVDMSVDVEEAMVIAIWPAWDNLEPYGSVGDVDITLTETNGNPTVGITTAATVYAGKGFVAGESIIIPVNFRNGSDGALTLGASITGNTGGLILEYCWRTNTGAVTEEREGEPDLARGFKDNDNWAFLKDWSAAIAGNGGESGSAVIGAQVLFVKITAPGDIPAPETHSLSVTFDRQ